MYTINQGALNQPNSGAKRALDCSASNFFSLFSSVTRVKPRAASNEGACQHLEDKEILYF